MASASKRGGVLGLDVGGANLKAAHSSGLARSVPFALWKRPAALPNALREVISAMPPSRMLAVTMTGELCDCFDSRRQGVQAILDGVEEASDGMPVVAWDLDGGFASVQEARRQPLLVAATNWLALATYVAQGPEKGPGLLLDIGSTTTDVVPFDRGAPVLRERIDFARLVNRELIYTGVRRTPLCALFGVSLAAELFATTLDAYLILGDLPEDAEDFNTADGRPATIAAAHARIARMLCADRETCPEGYREILAKEAREAQIEVLRNAVEAVSASLPRPPETVVLSGAGEFLGRMVLDHTPPLRVRRHSLEESLGSEVSQCACAYAVAIIAQSYYGIDN